MKQSFEDVKKWMLPVFNDITTIDDTIIFYLNYHSDCFGLRKEIFDQGLYTQDNEILLLSQIQNEDLVIEKYIQKLDSFRAVQCTSCHRFTALAAE